MDREQDDATDGRAERRRDTVSGDEVAEYLGRHPDFLARHPEILQALTPPGRWNGDGIVDMQQFVLERLRGEVENLRSCALGLIETSRGNLASQTRTHAAVMAVLATDEFEPMVRTISDHLPLLLDVDVVAIGFEPGPAPIAGLAIPDIRRLPEGTVGRLLSPGQDVALVPEMADDGVVFDAAAGLVRSAALARLRPGAVVPVGLLALGSRGPSAFHPGQGTELIAFLARLVASRIHRCLDRPA